MEVNEPSAKYLSSQFKRTEAGDIPIDWIEKPIGEMAEVTAGGTPSRQVTAFWDGDIPWITTAEIDGGQVTEASQYITAAGLQNSAAKWLPAGTLLIALYGQGKTRGKCAVLRIAATTNQACAGIKLKEGVDGDFVRHNLTHRYDYIRSLSNGGSQENLSGEIVKKIRVGMPSTQEEQRAIADALTDADALIDSLEQLLTKKRQIKQGAMQELLTGKRRLPGYTSPWITRRIGSFAPLQRGFDLPSRARRSGEYPVVYSNGILNFHCEFMVKGPGVVTGRSGTIGAVTFVEQNYWPHNTSLWVTSFNGSDPRFVFYLFQHIGLERFGTGSGVPTLNRNDVHAFEVHVPASVGEQAEIAQALSDIDTELTALESRVTKARALKQAMAQALLTGRIRIPLSPQEPTA